MKPSYSIILASLLIACAVFFALVRTSGNNFNRLVIASKGAQSREWTSLNGVKGGTESRVRSKRSDRSGSKRDRRRKVAVRNALKKMDQLALKAVKKKSFYNPTVRAQADFGKLREEFREVGGSDEEFMEWLGAFVETGGRNKYFIELIVKDAIRTTTKNPGRAALDFLQSLPPDSPYLKGSEMYLALGAWARADPEAAVLWTEQNPDLLLAGENPKVLNELKGTIGANWPEDDPAGAVAWLEQKMATEGSNMDPYHMGSVGKVWAKSDPTAAIAWISSKEERLQGAGATGIVKGWPKDSLDDAIEWIGTMRGRGSEYDGAREALAKRLETTDPIGAIAVAVDITNQADGDRLIIAAARNLNKTDPELVREWLPKSGLPKAAQRAILKPQT